MLYAGVCWRMLTYADVCRHAAAFDGVGRRLPHCRRPQRLRILPPGLHARIRQHTYACIRQHTQLHACRRPQRLRIPPPGLHACIRPHTHACNVSIRSCLPAYAINACAYYLQVGYGRVNNDVC
jgi:hypothetical protein